MAIDPRLLARDLRDAQALPGDPRPGTRELARTALGALGIELLRCDAEAVAARVLVPPTATGGFGTLLVAAETTASTAANLRCGPARRAFGAELNASATMPTDVPVVAIVVATELTSTDERAVWRVTAFEASGMQLLEGRCTLGVVAAPSTS